MDALQQAAVLRNLHEFGPNADRYPWITPHAARTAAEERTRRLARLAEHGAVTDARGTKPHAGDLAPGCRACLAGTWSCLFLNNTCQARCPYCPAPQDDVSVPGTNTLLFPEPETYAAYVNRFGFTGVSFSGGEPFLTFDRLTAYLGTVRKRCDPGIHTWVYTNGGAVTREHLRELADLGLDEIRFDIGAFGYSLQHVEKTAGIIPTVTVEIPAMPAHAPRLHAVLRSLPDAGVRYLNLHQLRCTRHNVANLLAHPVTLLHGPRVTVLESEHLALDVMDSVLTDGIPLAVNYCSFIYKHSFQGYAARTRAAAQLHRPNGELTRAGYLRRCRETPDGTEVTYFRPELRDAVSYRGYYETLEPFSGRKLVVESVPVRAPRSLSRAEYTVLADDDSDTTERRLPESCADIREFEVLPRGLMEYY